MAVKESAAHTLFFTIFAATLYYNIANIFIDGVTNSYGGRFKFLTFINIILSVLYYGIALLNDLATAQLFVARKKDVVKQDFSLLKCRDFLFGSLNFPLSSLVTFTFWGVMAFDSELMLPTNLREKIPVHGLYNHCAHSAPLLCSVLEMFIVNHPHFPSRTGGFLFFTAFCVVYVSWILWIAFKANIWVYPVLKVLSWSGKAVFIGSAYVFGLCGFFIGWFIDMKKRHLHTAKYE